MHRSRGQSAGPRDADEMCVSRVGWKRPDRQWKTRPNQPRKVHIRGSEKDELWDRPCARMGMSKSVLGSVCTLAFRQIGLNRIVTLGIVDRNSAQQVSRGSAFAGDARGNDLISEGCPGGARAPRKCPHQERPCRIALSPRLLELARKVPGTVSGPPRSTEVSRSRLVAHRCSDLRVLR